MDMEEDVENGPNSVHGKLMQSDSKGEENNKKADGKFDLKFDIYIRKHSIRGKRTGVKHYRADVRKCCLCACLILIILAIIGALAGFLIHFLKSTTSQVETRHGTIKGRIVKSPQGLEVDEYLGIPFAKPPLDDLRYSDPVPAESFPDGEFEAFDFRNSCIQYLDTTFGDFAGSNMWNAPNPLSEDCLYLNLWVPRTKKEEKLPVMVWIYGGGFFSGSNALYVYNGKALAAFGEVIVASFNYRVGTLGYLSTGDGRIKGNFGMKDQVMAMKWIKDNVAAFGGDPDLITIFGESSGASSAGLHLMSSHSNHLFKRAIYESGSPDCHWSFMTQTQARSRSKQFFQNVNCPDDDDILDCLRNLDPDTILNNEWVDDRFMVFPWAPSVDGDFLTDTPYNLLKQNKFQQKEALLGVNKDEGTYWILYALPGFSKDHESLQTYDQFQQAVDIIAWDLNLETRQRLKTLYSPTDTSDKAKLRDALDKVAGDRSFTCPTKEWTDILADSQVRTYFYYLTHRASNEPWPPWMGVIHGAEIQWVFGMPLNDSINFTPEEKEFTEKLMSYWVNFAKTGDPNGAELTYWPMYTTRNPQFIEMKGPHEIIVNNTLRTEYCDLWEEINMKMKTGQNVRR